MKDGLLPRTLENLFKNIEILKNQEPYKLVEEVKEPIEFTKGFSDALKQMSTKNKKE